MSRQRLRASLASQSHLKCSHCQGLGKVRNPELVALEVLRKIQAAIVVGHVVRVKARLAPAPALILLNNKKGELSRLESEHGVQIYILADGRLRPDEYEFEMETPGDRMSVADGGDKGSPAEEATEKPAQLQPVHLLVLARLRVREAGASNLRGHRVLEENLVRRDLLLQQKRMKN